LLACRAPGNEVDYFVICRNGRAHCPQWYIKEAIESDVMRRRSTSLSGSRGI
jgi:hypothetical protein